MCCLVWESFSKGAYKSGVLSSHSKASLNGNSSNSCRPETKIRAASKKCTSLKNSRIGNGHSFSSNVNEKICEFKFVTFSMFLRIQTSKFDFKNFPNSDFTAIKNMDCLLFVRKKSKNLK